MKNCIVLCMNGKFVKYTSYMIKQLSEYDIETPKYILVDNTVDVNVCDEMIIYGFKVINISNMASEIGILDRNMNSYPPIVISKLLIPFIDEFKQYERILYLDSDLQILNDFHDIFDLDLGTNDIGAVSDYNIRTWMKNYIDKLNSQLKPYSISFTGKEYINSGVVLFNNSHIQQIDKEELKRKLRKLVEIGYKVQFDYPDQDIINICFNIKYLPQKYNVLYRFTPRTDSDVFLHHIANKNDLDKIIKDNT